MPQNQCSFFYFAWTVKNVLGLGLIDFELWKIGNLSSNVDLGPPIDI